MECPHVQLNFFVCLTTYQELRAVHLQQRGSVQKLILFELPAVFDEIHAFRRTCFDDCLVFMNNIPAEFYATQNHAPSRNQPVLIPQPQPQPQPASPPPPPISPMHMIYEDLIDDDVLWV